MNCNPLEVLGVPQDLLLLVKDSPEKLSKFFVDLKRTYTKSFHPDMVSADQKTDADETFRKIIEAFNQIEKAIEEENVGDLIDDYLLSFFSHENRRLLTTKISALQKQGEVHRRLIDSWKDIATSAEAENKNFRSDYLVWLKEFSLYSENSPQLHFMDIVGMEEPRVLYLSEHRIYLLGRGMQVLGLSTHLKVPSEKASPGQWEGFYQNCHKAILKIKKIFDKNKTMVFPQPKGYYNSHLVGSIEPRRLSRWRHGSMTIMPEEDDLILSELRHLKPYLEKDLSVIVRYYKESSMPKQKDARMRYTFNALGTLEWTEPLSDACKRRNFEEIWSPGR